jgi:hypothetical protein
MVRRSAVSVFALVVAFGLGMMLSNRPATVSAQPAAGRGKCVGVVVSGYVVYRAFEDGTVEGIFDMSHAETKWHQVGK